LHSKPMTTEPDFGDPEMIYAEPDFGEVEIWFSGRLVLSD